MTWKCTSLLSGGPLHRFKHVYFETERKVGLGDTQLNIHALRHTFASRFQEATGDLVLLQALGGWSSLSMVGRYAHHRPERVADATAKMLAARDTQPESPQAAPRPITALPRNA